MSITIEEVRAYLNKFGMAMGHWDESVARLAISQHEELESLRAQLAEKDAQLNHFNWCLKNIRERLAGSISRTGDTSYWKGLNSGLSQAIAEIDGFPSLPTTTQDVIAKPPWEEAEEKRIRHFLSQFPSTTNALSSPESRVIAKAKNEAYEEAAQKCDESAETWLESFKQNGVSDARSRSFECENLAEAIRALKTEVKE